MPEILTVEGAGIRHAINGLLSLTPDGMPILGETPEVKNLWSVAAVWIKEGPGSRAPSPSGPWRAPPRSTCTAPTSPASTRTAQQRHVDARSSEGYNKTYGIVHPMEQWVSNRNVRCQPVPPARAGARRRLLRDGRLGAAVVVRVERDAARRVRRPGDAARGGVGVALVVADHQRRAPGDARPRGDDRPDARSRSSTSSARARSSDLQHIALAECDVEPGRVVYTPILDRTAASRPT